MIDGPDAPTEYVFPLELSDGVRLAPSDGGSVGIVDEIGFKIAFVALP